MANQYISWDMGTAYDLFISLRVLHNPNRFGLRGSWAAGVRSRLTSTERKALEEADLLFWIPLDFLYHLPAPKNTLVVLAELGRLPPAERLPALGIQPATTPEQAEVVLGVKERGSWDARDLERLKAVYKSHSRQTRQGMVETILDCWAHAAETGERFLAALQAYQDVFFAEEERRILPALEHFLDRARRFARRMNLDELIEELSQGVRFEPPLFEPDANLVLVPSFWSTPLVIYDRLDPGTWMFVYGGRPADASLVPGEMVPDAMLQSLKALADPTRLRILRYLYQQPMTPSQLAQKLRLRAPTVVHHLSELRLAGLVQLTVETPEKKSERRYAARLEAVSKLFETIQAFLSQQDYETIEEIIQS